MENSSRARGTRRTMVEPSHPCNTGFAGGKAGCRTLLALSADYRLSRNERCAERLFMLWPPLVLACSAFVPTDCTVAHPARASVGSAICTHSAQASGVLTGRLYQGWQFSFWVSYCGSFRTYPLQMLIHPSACAQRLATWGGTLEMLPKCRRSHRAACGECTGFAHAPLAVRLYPV